MKASTGIGIAVVTGDGRLFYELLGELRRRGVGFMVKALGEPLPLTVKAVLTSEAEAGRLEEALGSRVKVIGCKPGETSRAVSSALQVVYGLKAETLVIGVDPGKTFGYAAVIGGRVVEKASYSSLEGLGEALLRAAENWKPSMIVLKVGRRPWTESFLNEFRKLVGRLRKAGFKVELRLVDEAGTTVRAKRKGAKHREADEASAVEIALKEG